MSPSSREKARSQSDLKTTTRSPVRLNSGKPFLAVCYFVLALNGVGVELFAQAFDGSNSNRTTNNLAVRDYLENVKPLLKQKCYSCHGALKQEGELRVDTVEFMKQGGQSGPALSEQQSLLLARVVDHNIGDQMPLGGVPLDENQIATLRNWIDSGFPAPGDETPEESPESHWAFVPPRFAAVSDIERQFGALGTTDSNWTSPLSESEQANGVGLAEQLIATPVTHFLFQRSQLVSESDNRQHLARKLWPFQRQSTNRTIEQRQPEMLNWTGPLQRQSLFSQGFQRQSENGEEQRQSANYRVGGEDQRQAEFWDEKHPVDRWINAELATRGLVPLREASKDSLLRRLALDLTGFPPSTDDLHRFRNDHRPDAYEREVDRLLASPTFGQRWARHWMDVWRYADWFGRRSVPDVWNSAPQIWRWRDWIVDSTNTDLGYDQQIRLMLAADELAPAQPQHSVATGYLIRNWYALNPNDWMRANVEHSARAFLGLSIQCAHCHDHKYDPITQQDYFAYRAFFEPIGIRQDQLPGEDDPGPFQEYEYSTLRRVERRGRVSIFDRNPEAPTWPYAGGDERNRIADQPPAQPLPPSFLTPDDFRVEPITLPTTAWYPGLDPQLIQSTREALLNQLSAIPIQPPTEHSQTPDSDLIAAIDRLNQAASEKLQSPDLPASHRPINGSHSLLLDATNGRRIVQRHIPAPTRACDQPHISVKLRLLVPNHFNMQLARSSSEGLTAGYVGFDQGRILAYKPNSFDEFTVADFTPHVPITLLVEWSFQFENDLALLSITNLDSNTSLASQIPIAINGWKLPANPNQPITFDARNGSVAMLDDLQLNDLAHPDQPPLFRDDFEPNASPAESNNGQEIVGVDGWSLSHLSVSGAWSRVASVKLEPPLLELANEVERLAAAHSIASRDATSHSLTRTRLIAELKAYDAQVAAEKARIETRNSTDENPREAARALVLEAASAQRELVAIQDSTRVPTAIASLHQARALPLSDAARAAQIDAAEKQLSQLLTTPATNETVESAEAVASWDFDQPLPYPLLSRTYPETSTGRRAALALWITDRDNPLTARVAVNHIWARHFHRPIVSTVDDFGRNGARPSHQQLLDNLSVELMESGWSLKQIHRRIVTSAAYRRDSGRIQSEADEQLVARQNAIDPDNQWLWRRSPARMEAEVIRDSILAQAGRLDLRHGGQELENAEAFTSRRRSLYFSCQPEIDGRSEFAALFDAPDPTQCYRRTRSLMPQQALALTNSQLVHEQSLATAERLENELQASTRRSDSGETLDQEFIVLAFQTALSRDPTSDELQACLEFLSEAESHADQPADLRTRASLIRVLWNHHEFVTIR